MARNATGLFHAYILWRADSPEYREGYRCVMKENLLSAQWVEESRPIKDELMAAIETASHGSGKLCIATDDCVFYRRFNGKASHIHALMDDDTLSFTFRLGKNTTIQNYLSGELQPPLRAEVIYAEDQPYLRWDYKQYHYTANWGYPWGQDGCLFTCDDLARVISPMSPRTMRDIEGALHLPQHRDKEKKNLLCSPELSCVVNIPANSSQVDPTASGQRHPYSLKALNDRLLAGEVIDLDAMRFDEVRSAHKEIPLAFARRR